MFYRVQIDESKQEQSTLWCCSARLPKVGDVIRVVGGLKARVTEIAERKEPGLIRAEWLSS